MAVHAGISHAPNIRDSGIRMNISSIGENKDSPIIISIMPNVSFIIFNLLREEGKGETPPEEVIYMLNRTTIPFGR